MSKKHMLKCCLMIMVSVGLGLGAGASVAEENNREQPLQLRRIMQQMALHMQSTTGAIAREEWPTVAQLAPKIAAHEAPPITEKMRILAYVGKDVAAFKGFDAQTHEAAHAMAEAAQRNDGKAVIQQFAKVQEGCLGCHQRFRKAFVEYFYGKQ